MKVLIDPVYTGKVHKCSTSYLAWKIIEHVVSTRDDVFFYVLYPEAAENDEEQMAFLKQFPERVTCYPYPYIQADRVEEMWKLHERMIHLLSPGDTPLWDIDVVLTSRLSQIPYMRNVSNRETNYHKGSQRMFIGLEEMPIFSFRDTVAWAAGGNMDLQSLASYQAAHAIVINNLWSKREIMKIAKDWLSPSRCLDLAKSMHEVLPVKLQRLAKKKASAAKQLNVVFAGRMTGTRNFKEVAELFRKHFSYPLGKGDKEVKFIVSTNSASTGSVNVGEIDFMDVQHNNREQFHALLQDVADVVVNLSTVEDFSLSTYEPLLFGVPVIVPDRPWAGFLGPTYPFRAKDMTQAYAMVKDFAVDLPGQMKKFHEWEDLYWANFVKGIKNVSTAEVVGDLISSWQEGLHARLMQSEGGQLYRDIIARIEADGLKEVEPLTYAREKMEVFVTNAAQFKGIPVGKRPNAHLLAVYMRLAGWHDTNKPGVFVKEDP